MALSLVPANWLESKKLADYTKNLTEKGGDVIMSPPSICIIVDVSWRERL